MKKNSIINENSIIKKKLIIEIIKKSDLLIKKKSIFNDVKIICEDSLKKKLLINKKFIYNEKLKKKEKCENTLKKIFKKMLI